MATTTWALDTAHSHISFSVRHMMISNVRGSFKTFEAQVTADPTDLTDAKVSVKMDTKSIDTANEDRDNHLRSGDFFEADTYPTIEFVSDSVKKLSENTHTLKGQLTIKGVTRPIELTCEIEGPAKDPWGNERIGVAATSTINRSDFGLTYNAVLETGGVLVGDAIKLNIELEFVKQA
ncbi:YceI family protein [Ferroacidibacillus organovorans]|uniref:Lipid/polyisoprenoid-binding YceI-like domain-containing protein n=1 Tax=Ferroacidibacillus organovorans TaxID=1765683 RepID=A0A1V4EX45_9BACL|nr:YceI family protein [Ferroacidibacillus organovorans]OPG17430.1 hypothetical protein B2M26_01470 [Ferroacidibacillus organovorans]